MTVYIQEEYGYRYWKAEVDMTTVELWDWWSKLSNVEDNYLHKIFPTAVEISQESFKSVNVVCAHIHCNDDSWLRLPSGVVIRHAGYVNNPNYEDI